MVFDPAPPILEFLKIMSIVMIILVFGIPTIYVLFRAASLGWYRSRYEHFKQMLQHKEGEDL